MASSHCTIHLVIHCCLIRYVLSLIHTDIYDAVQWKSKGNNIDIDHVSCESGFIFLPIPFVFSIS